MHVQYIRKRGILEWGGLSINLHLLSCNTMSLNTIPYNVDKHSNVELCCDTPQLA